jgi:hypothetical protein
MYCFVDHCLSFCHFSFLQCGVLRVTTSEYIFCIFLEKPETANRRTDNTMAKWKGQATIQSITQNSKDRATRRPLKTGSEHRGSGIVSSFCSIRGTCRVTLVTNPVIINKKTDWTLTITQSNTVNDTFGAETVYPWGAIEITTLLLWTRFAHIFGSNHLTNLLIAFPCIFIKLFFIDSHFSNGELYRYIKL